MLDVISVTPAATGWSVQARGMESAMMFLSGAKAEAAARKLGLTAASRGVAAEVRIFLRDGSLAGRIVCSPGA